MKKRRPQKSGFFKKDLIKNYKFYFVLIYHPELQKNFQRYIPKINPNN